MFWTKLYRLIQRCPKWVGYILLSIAGAGVFLLKAFKRPQKTPQSDLPTLPAPPPDVGPALEDNARELEQKLDKLDDMDEDETTEWLREDAKRRREEALRLQHDAAHVQKRKP